MRISPPLPLPLPPPPPRPDFVLINVRHQFVIPGETHTRNNQQERPGHIKPFSKSYSSQVLHHQPYGFSLWIINNFQIDFVRVKREKKVRLVHMSLFYEKTYTSHFFNWYELVKWGVTEIIVFIELENTAVICWKFKPFCELSVHSIYLENSKYPETRTNTSNLLSLHVKKCILCLDSNTGQTVTAKTRQISTNPTELTIFKCLYITRPLHFFHLGCQTLKWLALLWSPKFPQQMFFFKFCNLKEGWLLRCPSNRSYTSPTTWELTTDWVG